MKLRSSITAKTTALAWTIALGSLLLFVAFIIPEQKLDLESSLESKGKSILAALQGEVASAAVTEDYSAVVEHAMGVVAGDPSVEFIVLAKNDGYAVVVERNGWRVVPNIDASWISGARVPATSIGVVPMMGGKRLFHYRTPLDCLGIPWGWVHVGLSLDAYDEAVRTVYIRTGLLGIACILLSLLASILFARRFVRPILALQAAVRKLAQGDLEARADVETHGEIAELGAAFNEMADAILKRNRIVECVRYCAQTLQSAEKWDSVIDTLLAQFGSATGASRAALLRITLDAQGSWVPIVPLEWAAEGIAAFGRSGRFRTVEEVGISARCQRLMRGEIVKEHSASLEAEPFWCPEPYPKSLIAAPVFADKQFWGVLTLQDCVQDREWSEVEEHSIRAIVDMLGASIMRQRAQRAMLAAKDQLETRVAERTAELREQIAARDAAHAELKRAQQELIEMSRISGMAEVATGVLHNVGNVLNSINVSATLVADRVNSARLTQLHELATMLAAQDGHLSEFLSSDPRGQRVVPYLGKLSDHLLKERSEMRTEAESLVKYVGHVKEIVSMQQGYARNLGLLEKVSAEELMESALKITEPAMLRHGIQLERQYRSVPQMITDRHKVLQILLNLIQNAKDAVKSVDSDSRRIAVRILAREPARVLFEVEDNGIGISPENLARIFSHGFTTKPNGHGFGLHSGALAATDLGGSLRVASDGVGLGAVFTLELPLEAANRANQEESLGK